MAAPSLVVLDVDGTLVPEGHGSTPSPTAMDAIDALRDRATFALVSGRTEPDLRKVARAADIPLLVCELGAYVVDGGSRWPTVDLDGETDPADRIRESGVLDAIRDRFPDVDVDPYGHRITVPVHGDLGPDDVVTVREIVEAHDGDWTLLDNTVDGRIVVLHVAPPGLGKARGVAALQDHLDVPPAETVVVGDSPQDAACHAQARRIYVVANGTTGDVDAGGVVRTEGEDGDGVAEALEDAFRR